MKYALLIGRILFAVIFLMSGPAHFSAATIGFAASKGLPMASVLVPLSGIVEIIGGLSVLLGYKTKWGALLLIVFLIPVTFTLHTFWNITDPMMRQMDMAAFMKNISMTGAALMITYFGAGPISIDNKQTAKA